MQDDMAPGPVEGDDGADDGGVSFMTAQKPHFRWSLCCIVPRMPYMWLNMHVSRLCTAQLLWLFLLWRCGDPLLGARLTP